MRVKPWLALWVLGVVAVGILMLSGCSSGSPSAANPESPVTDTTVAADDAVPVVEDQETTSVQTDEAPADEDEPGHVVDTEPVEDASAATSEEAAAPEEPVEEPLLTWGRTAGGLSHCDHMSIFPDGSTEAVVCRAGRSEPTVVGTLSDEQLAQVANWVAEYSSFTRREQEPSGAVRTTTLNGTGAAAPELAIKKEIAAFAVALYFELTGTE